MCTVDICNLRTSLPDWDKKSTGVLYSQYSNEVDMLEELDSVIQKREKSLKN
jgi:hypothetical protein